MRKNYFLPVVALIVLFLAAVVHTVLPVEGTTSTAEKKINTVVTQNYSKNFTGEEDDKKTACRNELAFELPIIQTDAPQVPLELHKLTVEEIIALFSFLDSPIKNASVPTTRGQLPNATRSYRNGIHEGIDYYGFPFGKEVIATAIGVVIRIDHDFVEMTLEEYNEAIRAAHESVITPEAELDKFRGKQVWLKHQNNIITRYAHLDSVVSEIKIGQTVEAGQVIGTVGNTGTKSSVVGKILNPSGAPHLHFEVWLGDMFLGQGLPYNEVLYIYREIFE